MKTDVFSHMDPKNRKKRDQRIVLRVQEGDTAAFDELYTNYIDQIYRFVYYRVFDKELAEDLTSDTFLKALKNIAALREQDNFSAWLYRIAYHTVIDNSRTTHKHTSLDDEESDIDVVDTLDVERTAAHKQLLNEAYAEVMKLEAPARDIVLMRVWDELSYEEIAEVVGKSRANCRMIFSRSIQGIRGAVSLSAYLLLVSFNI